MTGVRRGDPEREHDLVRPHGPVRRHDLVWLDPGFEPAGSACDDPIASRSRLRAGLPFVVARQHDLDATRLRVGFTLPGTGRRTRIGLIAPRAAIARQAPPPRLRDAIAAAPASWRGPMDRLAASCERLGMTPRLYGSLAQQLVSGERCLHADSDLDVLIDLEPSEALAPLLRALRAPGTARPRIDGEIRSRGGWSVAWRELAAALLDGSRPFCLAKSDRDVRLLPVGGPHDEFRLVDECRPLASSAACHARSVA